MNPNKSETEFSIRINQNESKVGMIRIDPARRNFLYQFYYSIFQFREKRITLRIFVSKNTKLYNNDMKLQRSS